MRIVRKIIRWLVLFFVVCFLVFFFIKTSVQYSVAQFIYPTVESLPKNQVGMILGAQVFPHQVPSVALANRLQTAAQLYKKGKIQSLLMSGDGRSPYYDEVSTMKKYAEALQVPGSAILLDEGGLRTYDSCYRAKQQFHLEKVTVITQYDHLLRSVYTCRSIGLQAIGVAAPEFSGRQPWKYAYWEYILREQAALIGAWLDVNVIHPNPS